MVAVKVTPHRGGIVARFVAVSALAPVLWLVPPVLSFERLGRKRTICGFAILPFYRPLFVIRRLALMLLTSVVAIYTIHTIRKCMYNKRVF